MNTRSQHPLQSACRSGFTLVELMVVVGIAAMVTVAFVGSSILQSPEQRLDGECWELVGALREARTQAVMGNCSVEVTFTAATKQYTVWMDADRDGSVDTGERTSESLNGSYVSSMIATPNSGTFTSTGMLETSSGNPLQITVSNSQADSRKILLLPSGEVDATWN